MEASLVDIPEKNTASLIYTWKFDVSKTFMSAPKSGCYTVNFSSLTCITTIAGNTLPWRPHLIRQTNRLKSNGSDSLHQRQLIPGHVDLRRKRDGDLPWSGDDVCVLVEEERSCCQGCESVAQLLYFHWWGAQMNVACWDREPSMNWKLFRCDFDHCVCVDED